MGGNPSALAILTRPQGRNDALAARLERHGMGALVLPALQLIPGEVGAMPSPDGFDLVLFVSGYAAQCYFQAQAAAAWPAGTLAAAVGASTLQAIAHWGKVPATALFGPPDDSLQDSEALWQSLQDAGIRPQRVLIVRGSTGRDWLGQRLQQDGAQVTWLAAYRRDPAVWTASQGRALADAVRQHAASLLLMVFGTATLLGNFAGGRWAASLGWPVALRRMLAGLLLAFVALALLMPWRAPMVLLLFAWGLLAFGMSPGFQAGMLATAGQWAPRAVDFASALNISAFNLGITLGETLGSSLVARDAMALTPWVGVGLAALAQVPLMWLARRSPNTPAMQVAGCG